MGIKLNLSRKDKIFFIIFLIIYIVVAVLNYKHVGKLEGVGQRWIIGIGISENITLRLNPLTVIMSWAIMVFLMLSAVRFKKNLSLIPSRFQAFFEYILSFIYEIVEDAIPRKELVKPVFYISATLFLFIVISNILGGFPGIQVVPTDEGIKISLFQDTWFSPTADINTNATYAVMVLILSHAFAIKVKGFWRWFKSFFEPNPLMFPMNVIGELAKPISHSLRLFGNIAGGGILVLILSYMTKYIFIPVILWGFFGLFVGVIQALVFSMLAIAYISAQIE